MVWNHVRPLLVIGCLIGAGCVSTETAKPERGTARTAGDRRPEAADWGDLDWLVGKWGAEDERGVWTEESWSAPEDDTMVGVNRTVVAGRIVFFEDLRVARAVDGVLVYLAAPAGRQPATPFRLTTWRPGRLVFENPDHDFPKRIIYEHGADGSLSMRVEGDGQPPTRSAEWRLLPLPETAVE